MVGITVHKDENGVLREYREEKRAARGGELVKVVKVIDGFDAYQVGDILKIVRTEGEDTSYFHQAYINRNLNDEEGQAFLLKDEYVVLLPTNVIHHEGKRYREVKRVGKQGELAIVVGNTESTIAPYGEHQYKLGDVVRVIETVDETSIKARRLKDGETQWIGFDDYRILEQIDDALEQTDRIAALEKTVTELRKRVDVLEEKLEEAVKGRDRDEMRVLEKLKKLKRNMPKPTRDEIVERAKKDVEELEHYGKSTDGLRKIPGRFGHIYYRVKFIVNREKRTVVALVYEAYASGSIDKNVAPVRGIAKCAPEDCFNVWLGRAISLRRALGLDVPDEYLNAPQPEYKVGDRVNVCYRDERITGTIARIYERDDKACLYRVKFDNGHWDVFTYNELSDDVDDSKSTQENEPTVTFNKEKALQLLACLLHSVYPVESDSPGYDRRKLINMGHMLMWDIASVFGYDLNEGYINPTTLEFVRYND
jgi:mRNA-degrading endonuclease RelE of RelBE toxin-antitoxin system